MLGPTEFTYKINDIDAVASRLLGRFKSKVVLFNGPMGAGKTTLITALLRVMESSDKGTSPTFSIVNEYQTPDDRVYHFDFYRIESIDDVHNLGIDDYFYSDHWLFLEWADRIEQLLPEAYDIVDITILNHSQRSLKLTRNNEHLTPYEAMTELKF